MNINQNSLPVPLGLQHLYKICRNVYPDQSNPLQVAALIKYWLGGPDPLDYVSMYSNSGCKERNIPPHWHYVSYGLSDLHGDGRVHQTVSAGLPSGFGFELTFRLKKSADETVPPTWPATLMQSLAKYVFSSGNVLAVGDHVSWPCSLDGREYSMIRHILLDKDAQLSSVDTPLGTVDFIQIVGIHKEELEAAQKWNGLGVISIFKQSSYLGGPWMITDMSRTRNMFEIDESILSNIENGMRNEGSTLTGVSCHCLWSDQFISRKEIVNSIYFKEEFMKKYCSYIYINDEQDDYMHRLQSFGVGDNIDYSQSKEFPLRIFDRLHIILNKDAGALLPLVISGRLKHGRHFTFKSVTYNVAITFVAPSVTGANKFVNENQPYVLYGPWLQIYIPENFITDLEHTLQIFNSSNKISFPKMFYWSQRNFAISIISENEPVVPESNSGIN